MKQRFALPLLASLGFGLVATDVYADRDGHWGHGAHRYYGHSYGDWRRGDWHGDYDDDLGWWWGIGGLGMLYSQPGYPYPFEPYSPPVVVVQPSPPPVPLPPQTQYWYYCDGAQAYYPHVTSCPNGWRQVPVTPAGATP